MDVFEVIEKRKKEILCKSANAIKDRNKVKELMSKYTDIYIIADYDCDGICAATEAYLILTELGKNVAVRFPKRFSEGYGLSEKIVDEIINSVPLDTLICTVDNGIAAYNEISKLKYNGYSVLITDHHLVPIKDDMPLYPPADIIIDESDGKTDGNTPWCGAGLVYALMTQLDLPVSQQTFNTVTFLAGLATVADLVPLINGNRKLVKESLKIANQMDFLNIGVSALLKFLNSENIDEFTYGFQLGPMINAAGRLYDDGAKGVFDILISDNIIKSQNNIKTLGDINQKRKELSYKYTEQAKIVLGQVENCAVPEIDVPSGIRGLVAGQLTEEFNVPSFVFTKDGDVLKGSARSVDDIDIFEMVNTLNKENPNLINKFGGHKAAMGIEIPAKNIKLFKDKLNEKLPAPKIPEFKGEADIELYSDFEKIYKEMNKLAPFGMGNPVPVFRLNGYKPIFISNEKKYILMGNYQEHIKFSNGNITALGFSKANDFIKEGEPEKIDMLVTPMLNVFRCKKEIQLDISALKKSACE